MAKKKSIEQQVGRAIPIPGEVKGPKRSNRSSKPEPRFPKTGSKKQQK